jgi:hypothetical protein
MDYDDPIDEFLKPERLEDFHQAEQKTVAAENKMRSAADDVIDALGGISRKPKPKVTCAKCKGTEFNTFRPLSGPVVKQCATCGTRTYGASRSPVWMSEVGHAQGVGGAYYRGSEVAPVATETHSPRSRTKSRNYTKDDT